MALNVQLTNSLAETTKKLGAGAKASTPATSKFITKCWMFWEPGHRAKKVECGKCKFDKHCTAACESVAKYHARKKTKVDMDHIRLTEELDPNGTDVAEFESFATMGYPGDFLGDSSLLNQVDIRMINIKDHDAKEEGEVAEDGDAEEEDEFYPNGRCCCTSKVQHLLIAGYKVQCYAYIYSY